MSVLSKRYIPMKTKLILLVIVLLSMPFIILMFIWYKSSGKVIENQTVALTTPLVEQISEYMDSYFKTLEKETLALAFSPIIRNFVELDKDNYYEQFYVVNQIKNEVYPKLTNGRTDVLAFYIVSDKGLSYSSTDDVSIDLNSVDEIYLNSLKLNADDKTFGIQGISKINEIPVLTVVREISFSSPNRKKGYIIVVLNLDKIKSFLEIKLGNTGFFSVVDWDGKYIYHPDENASGTIVYEEILKNINTAGKGYFTQNITGNKKLFVYNKAEISGCTVICEVPFKELTGSLEKMRDVSILISIISVLLIIFIIGGYTYSIIISLINLQQLMKRVEKGELNVQAVTKQNDEIGNLNDSFNKMVGEIRRLIEVVHETRLKEKEAQIQQKEAFIQALQSQINPHFLYNVLESINSYAIVKGEMPISNMVTCLADMFRYSVNNTKHLVTLDDELKHLEIYMQIQKDRYHGFIYETEIEDPYLIEAIMCIRLTLQPIIENSFIHGYEKHGLKPGFIGLQGRKNDGWYELVIEDHGMGMNSQSVEIYNDFFENGGEDEKLRNDNQIVRGKIGLLNVHKRIRLTFGMPYGLYIIESDTSGTKIMIKLPYSETVRGRAIDK